MSDFLFGLNDKIKNPETNMNGSMKSNKYYVFNYKVPKSVVGDEFLNGGYSQAVSARFLRRSNGVLIFDDLFSPRNKKLTGSWPNQKFGSITYSEDSKDYYNKTGGDNSDNTFNLNPFYIHDMERLPNKRDSS